MKGPVDLLLSFLFWFCCVRACVRLVINVTRHIKGNLVTQPDVFIAPLFITADGERNACGFTLHVIYVLDTVFGFVSVHRYQK